MPLTCCAVNCAHNPKNCKLKRFPRNETRAKEWENMLRRKDFTRTEYHRICACHFDDNQYDDFNKNRLRPDAVPLLFSTHTIKGKFVNSNSSSASTKEQMKEETPSEAELLSMLNNLNGETEKSDANEPHSLVLEINSIEDCMKASQYNFVLEEEDPLEIICSTVESPDEIFILDDDIPMYDTEFYDNGGPVPTPDNVVPDSDCAVPTFDETVPVYDDRISAVDEDFPIFDAEIPVINSLMDKTAMTNHENLPDLKNLQDIIKQLEKEKAKITRENYRLKKEITNLKKVVSNFNTDEVKHLEGRKVMKWSKETVRKCLQIRFACGRNGYEFLRSQGYPLLAYSTLCQRVQKLPLKCGISDKILYLLKQKAVTMKNPEKHCVLSLDEMEITERLDYDQGQKQVIGYATLGDKTVVACKLLLLVARGVTTKWKQVIGWHLTTSTAPPASEVWDFVLDGIRSLEKVNYKAHGLVNDMAGPNRNVWKAAGIVTATRKKPNKRGRRRRQRNGSATQENTNKENNNVKECEQQQKNDNGEKLSVPHPVRPNDEFYFFADAAHLLKNLKAGFLKCDFHLPPELLEKYNLIDAPISSKWLYEYIEIQNEEEAVFRLAPYLTLDLLKPTHYEKMRVGLATAIFSDEVAAALETAVIRNLIPEEAKPTIWFIRKISNWYRIMSGRHLQDAVTRKNFPRNKRFIDGVTEIFRNLKTSDNQWKPYQAGIILTNHSFLKLSEKLLFTKEINYFLGSRMLQDGVENIFSQIRFKGTICPSALQALRAVRLLCFSQFSREVKTSNYDYAGDKHHLDILSSPIKRPKRAKKKRPFSEVSGDRNNSGMDNQASKRQKSEEAEVKQTDDVEQNQTRKQLRFEANNATDDRNNENAEDEAIYAELSKVLNFPVQSPSESLEPLEEQALSDAVGHIMHCLEKVACFDCEYFNPNLSLHESIYSASRDRGGLRYAPIPLFNVGKKLEMICRKEMKNIATFSMDNIDSIIAECVRSCGEPLCDCPFFREFCCKFVRSRLYFLLQISNRDIADAARKRRQGKRSRATASQTLKMCKILNKHDLVEKES